MDPLRVDLCRLARELDYSDVRLALVGGYGLLLKAEYIRKRRLETVGAVGFPRATDDLPRPPVEEFVQDLEGLMAGRGE